MTPDLRQALAADDPEAVTVAVVGLGYIGLPLVRALLDGGYRVLGVDVDPTKIEALTAGEDYLTHLGAGFAAGLARSGRFEPTVDHGRVASAHAVLVCVPTPLKGFQEPDLSYVERTTSSIAPHLGPGALFVLVSTTWPGTTREVVLPRLEAAGRVLGRDLFVAFSPEREDPGRTDHTTASIPRLVGGLDDASRELAVALLSRAVDELVPCSSAEVAESAKLLENVYRAVNIAMVNELKMVLTAMDVDVQEVVDAASTKPFGFEAFRPGPGLGGHCLPIDPFYLAHRARQFGVESQLVELAGRINQGMPVWVVRRVIDALESRGVPLDGSRLLLLGLAYKPDVGDVRESPAHRLIEALEHLGARVDYHDPHVPESHPVRHASVSPRRSVELTAEALAGYDAVVVATHHSAIDWDLVASRARLVIDTRGALRGRGDHIIPA